MHGGGWKKNHIMELLQSLDLGKTYKQETGPVFYVYYRLDVWWYMCKKAPISNIAKLCNFFF